MLSVPVFRKARAPYEIEFLMIAGGGGGGGNGGNTNVWPGGGGAGGVIWSIDAGLNMPTGPKDLNPPAPVAKIKLTPGTKYDIVIGTGGAGGNNSPGQNGTNTTAFGLTAIGGGGGGFGGPGNSGGSSGGGSGTGLTPGGSPTAGQGNTGGASGNISKNGGGGGGAGRQGSRGASAGEPGSRLDYHDQNLLSAYPGATGQWICFGGWGIRTDLGGSLGMAWYAAGGSGFGPDYNSQDGQNAGSSNYIGGKGGSYIGGGHTPGVGGEGAQYTGSGGGAGSSGGKGGDGTLILKIPAKFYRQENHKGAVQILARTPNHVIIQYKGDGYLIA